MPDQGSVKMRPWCLKVTAKYLETSSGFYTLLEAYRLCCLTPRNAVAGAFPPILLQS